MGLGIYYLKKKKEKQKQKQKTTTDNNVENEYLRKHEGRER